MRDETEHETGPVVRADLRYVLPDFTVSGNVRWTTASAEDNHFSGTLGAFYALPRGLLFGRVYQRAVGDVSGDEVRVTGATIGLEREINSVSRIGLDLGWATQVRPRQTTPSPTSPAPTSSRATRSTSPRWSTAEVGYNYQTRDEDPVYDFRSIPFGPRPDVGHDGAACTSRICPSTNPRAPACPGRCDSAPARQARADYEPTGLRDAPRPPRCALV